jgi:hypothetical protein
MGLDFVNHGYRYKRKEAKKIHPILAGVDFRRINAAGMYHQRFAG